jgi:RNA polymerase I-specific transcription initiation factor RRN11
MMSFIDHFLFASLDSKGPTSARKVHIRRLHDILQLSLQRNDMPRAKAAWAILIRCKEIDWKGVWTTGLLLLGEDANGFQTNPEQLEFLRAMMLQYPEEVSLQRVLRPTRGHLNDYSVKL